MIFISFLQHVPRPSYPFRRSYGRSGKGSFAEKPKIINSGCLCCPRESTCSKNMILISSPYLVLTPSYPIRGKFGRTGKGSSNEKAKIVDRGSLCNGPESTCSKVQYESYFFSVACSQTELSISGKIWRSGKGSFTVKAKIVDSGSLCCASETTGSKLQYDPYFISVAFSYTQLSISGKMGRSGKGQFNEKAKIAVRGSLCSALESTGSKLQYEPSLFSVACSWTNLSISVKNFGVQVKGSFTEMLKSLIEVPSVAHLNTQVPSFKMILITAPQRVPRPSCPFWEKNGRTGKVSFTDKAKVVDSGSICSTSDSTGSKLQYEPYLFSVACS